jgi:acetyltransferase
MEEQSESDAGYPSQEIEMITLRDGTEVKLRPIRPDDAPRLQQGFKQLSTETIYLRFLKVFYELSDKQAYEFANIDYQTQMAFVGEIQENGEPALIAVARYALVGEQEPRLAEAAVVVRDDYQNLGMGTAALQKLVRYAADHSVSAFLATIHISNNRIMHFFKKSGLLYERKMLEPGTWEVRVYLS